MSATVQYESRLLAGFAHALHSVTELDAATLQSVRAAAQAQLALPCSAELRDLLCELVLECSGELSEQSRPWPDDDGDPPLVGDIDLW